jgi:hypothetical protein
MAKSLAHPGEWEMFLPEADRSSKEIAKPKVESLSPAQLTEKARAFIDYPSEMPFALIKPGIPNELLNKAIEIVTGNGFTKALPWRAIKGQFYCEPQYYDKLAVAQSIGSEEMTFDKRKMDMDMINEVGKYLDGYVFDPQFNHLANPNDSRFVVFGKQ